MSSFDLEKKFQERCDDATQQKESQQAKIKQLQDHLQKLFNKMPKRPRETLKELDEKIDALETKRTITSISLAEERQILRDINGIKKSKTQVEEYLAIDKEIQETKNQLNELRDGLKTTNALVSELESALSKVQLANKLGCTTQDLTTHKMECPQDKLGMVIGKNGAMVKQIQEKTKVSLDISKEDCQISITGGTAAIQEAVNEINKIVLAIEESFEAPKTTINYMTSRHIEVISALRKEYPDVYMDISRATQTVVLRGIPGLVNQVKDKILNMDIATEERPLVGRETQILVGRKGSTIEMLVSTHGTSIDVEKINEESAMAYITGPPSNVEKAMAEIEELMNVNKEVIEKIPVVIMVKRMFLADAGAQIKALQAKVNEALKEKEASAYLSFDKDQSDFEPLELLVKAKQLVILEATELAEAGVKELVDMIVRIDVDPYIIPRIIGKGGETIKKLTEGKSAFIEVDRDSGKVSVGATNLEDRDYVIGELNKILDENNVVRVDADKNMMKAQFREMIRSKTKNEISALAWIDNDEENGKFILRGTNENLEKAKELLENFLKENYIDELPITEEDLDTLLVGGAKSILVKLSADLEVNLYADKTRFVLAVRGLEDKVKNAIKKIDQFLNGGEGNIVSRLTVTEQVVGVVIGKGGKTRQGLEAKYEGVSINISKTHRISIRGPKDQVEACRVEVLKLISSVRVNQSVPVDEKQQKALEKNDFIKRITQTIPVQISFENEQAKVRGFFTDVCDAVSLLKEQTTGVYETSVELEAAQFNKVKNATRDPSHFERMESASSAKVELDLGARSIVLKGKRSNVKRAKEQLFGFLDFLLPNEFLREKLPIPYHSTVGSATTLADVSAVTGGTMLYLDRDLNSVIIRSTDTDNVQKALEMLREKTKEAEKLVFVIEISTAEAWLIPLIIGKNGAQITSLQKEAECNINVSREQRTITVTGDDETKVKKARELLDGIIDKARKECVFVSMPEVAMPSFVGRAGANVIELSKQYGVDIQRMKKGNSQLRIQGKEDAVESAKQAVEAWLASWEKNNASVDLPIDKQDVVIIIGNKGAVARSVEEEFGCKIEVDRQNLVIKIRGATEEKRDEAMQKIKQTIAEASQKTREMKRSTPRDDGHHAKEGGNENNHSLPQPAEPSAAPERKFPENPVGLTAAPKRGKKKGGATVAAEGNGSQRGTEAGRKLFNLLASD